MKALVFVLVGSCNLFCQTANEPLPGKWLHDGHFSAPEYNFSMDSPIAGSQWSYRGLPNIQGRKATAFTISTPAKNDYTVIVLEIGGRMDSSNTRQFIDGMQKSLPKEWRIQDTHIESTSVPVGGSYKFRVELHLPDDSLLYSYGYVVPSKRTYVMIDYSRDAMEPVQFSNFVSSFTLLSPNETTTSDTTNALNGVLLILALSGAVADWKYRRRGGSGSTKTDKLVLASGVSLCIVLLVVLGFRGASAEGIGSISGQFLVVIFALWQFHRWSFRRRNPIPVAIPIPVDEPVSHIKTFCTKCGGALMSDMVFCGTCGTRRS